jgi:hypothetical protein
MLLSHHQNAGQIQDINIGNRWLENVAQFRYLGTITNQNLIQEEPLASIKCWDYFLSGCASQEGLSSMS